MDYQRIQNNITTNTHQGNVGVLSPKKLRSMLLGVEDKFKKIKHQDQEVSYSLNSEASRFGYAGGCFSDDCKDVDVVSVQPEYTTSTTPNAYTVDVVSDRKTDNSLPKSSLKSQDNCYSDYDSGHEYMSVPSPMFEFPKRGALASFSKPTPSKWDDAQKWIASPTSNRTKAGGQLQGNSGSRKTSVLGFGSRKQVTKVVVEVPDQRLVPLEEPDTKRIDCSETISIDACKAVGWEAATYLVPESYRKEIVVLDNCEAEPAINPNGDDISAPQHSETTSVVPPSAARSVSMRDMGTEMTPIASQEPSRNGTPVRATTPDRSPTTSRSSTPQKRAPDSSFIIPPDLSKELSEKELQMKTRREIMALGTQLGKTNIAAWASKEEENSNVSTNIVDIRAEEIAKASIEARAAAWEEAEKAKYIARFKREEMKIEAWENHEKAKAEAELRRAEVKIERMRGRAHERLVSKLSDTKHQAEEKRAFAEAKRKQQDAKTEQQINCIRANGCLSYFHCCGWCL